MPFTNDNVLNKISKTNKFQVGVSNKDSGVIEQEVKLGWAADPAGSYVYYDCTVGVILDSGIVVHNTLPQVDNLTPDTLSSMNIEDPRVDKIIDLGVNLSSRDQYQDIVQRMGHSRYWFVLRGQALRLGYKIPIPGIKVIGGVKAIPYDKNPQWAFNRIFPSSSYGGVILWHAGWSLWYTTLNPPISQNIPVIDLSAHIRGSSQPPESIQVPYSLPDNNAVDSKPTLPQDTQGFTVQGKTLR